MCLMPLTCRLALTLDNFLALLDEVRRQLKPLTLEPGPAPFDKSMKGARCCEAKPYLPAVQPQPTQTPQKEWDQAQSGAQLECKARTSLDPAVPHYDCAMEEQRKAP